MKLSILSQFNTAWCRLCRVGSPHLTIRSRNACNVCHPPLQVFDSIVFSKADRLNTCPEFKGIKTELGVNHVMLHVTEYMP